MSSVAIIAASGVGKRMNLRNGLSKQFLEIGGYPVIYHTLAAFQRASSIDKIYIATKPDSIATLETLAEEHQFSKINAIIAGGKERQDSISNCIELIALHIEKAEIDRPDTILVHDGARPFITPDEIDQIAQLSHHYGACVPATKPKDTIKYISDQPGFFGETLDRSLLLQVQTPQGFASEKLVEAHRKAREAESYATDDAALVEKFFPDQKIKVFEMGYHNIKITTPEDIFLGEAIYAQLQQQS
ncbi:MAG: 2-C-methyl-D-erythritol 4-phosphate cytidylyltransferase [Prosthecochloris sp.]|uniref:2-C-methyl-D-erythritol 4-phosphate cytidylyltransferase n=1 Tax=Prosthecochloris aestuarii (strain DSM 271 / SK 413) TaxID=290512 RepID=ISPD_PROA2|nr:MULTISPECIES: 2-C-methyl-D-erythritol 4-phosphate cytidylyltransferase [Prosthecochloris]B4S8U7.1 RecName: Full=2-C-methyl-D-erythritol 4-phosphate cytidylyltransferase; AltName: Full=4-diphosphocytidyl-2C-methyl-D-erythritol synthase; AltName: Full=MEP cytidylyltransferase; Short=MCT [Prosthecochloris aestuarii DSM 271]ACF46484.1 2-C-methyl-D-erythritol 4-phosphate cytidylyltransferase [Prosthecochloris aestuarii DSM 271]MCW8798107.1 2-C-methyl-D-erythritol 4-phosphate cytidylyltransferase [